eukprot:3850871-Pyramimonas_sp.AAC.1
MRREQGCRYQVMKAMNIAVESTFAMGTQRGIGLAGSDIPAGCVSAVCWWIGPSAWKSSWHQQVQSYGMGQLLSSGQS